MRVLHGQETRGHVFRTKSVSLLGKLFAGQILCRRHVTSLRGNFSTCVNIWFAYISPEDLGERVRLCEQPGDRDTL